MKSSATQKPVHVYEGNRPLFTTQQRLGWTETDWNWHMRQALIGQGYRALHIREASETGVADLLVYQNREIIYDDAFGVEDYSLQVIEAWLELKKDNSESEVRPAQRQFMRDHWRIAHNAMFVMYDRKLDMLAVRQGDLKGRVVMLPADPYLVQWKEVFAKFSIRK